MAKLVYAVLRQHAKPSVAAALAARITRVLARLVPDNLQAPAPRLIVHDGIVAGICNPAASLPVSGASVCMGVLHDAPADWSCPGAPAPDGSYALFRADPHGVELLTDISGSRTIWYAQTPDILLAATSQRALVMLLGSFEFEPRALGWLVASGTLGPGFSWDRRIGCLANDSRLHLDRHRWTLTRSETPVAYVADGGHRRDHAARLDAALDHSFATLDLAPERWIVPLSGGYDSRAVAALLAAHVPEIGRLRTVTWGLRDAPADRLGDAAIAQRVADSLGTAHAFLSLDGDVPVDFEQVLARFVAAGEGRTDRISAYIDGLALWARLHAMDCDGILRGDEAFGCRRVASDFQVLRNMHVLVPGDLAGLPAAVRGTLAEVRRPDALLRRADETRAAWRDRLGIGFEHPYLFAALNDLKLAYVEVAHPLLTRRIVEAVRTLPDELRTDKKLFRERVLARVPPVPIARNVAIPARAALFASARFRAAMCAALDEAAADDSPFDTLAKCALDGIDEAAADGRGWRERPWRRALKRVRRRVGWANDAPPVLSPGALALRVVVAHRTVRLLREDAVALAAEDPAGVSRHAVVAASATGG